MLSSLLPLLSATTTTLARRITIIFHYHHSPPPSHLISNHAYCSDLSLFCDPSHIFHFQICRFTFFFFFKYVVWEDGRRRKCRERGRLRRRRGGMGWRVIGEERESSLSEGELNSQLFNLIEQFFNIKTVTSASSTKCVQNEAVNIYFPFGIY